MYAPEIGEQWGVLQVAATYSGVPGVLVDHRGDLDGLTVDDGVELEVDRPESLLNLVERSIGEPPVAPTRPVACEIN